MGRTKIKHRYNASFILDTRGLEETIDSVVDQLKAAIVKVGGKVSEVDNHGRIDFARVTDKKHPADFYLHIYFEGPPESPRALQDNLRLENAVKRIIIQSAV